jgi:dienelactone hydrolase
MIDLSKLKVAGTWMAARSEVREEVLKLLGELPKEHADLQVKIIDEIDFPGYVRKRINYFVDNWTRISAWLFIPEGDEEWPAIVCCHQEVPQGKEQMAGLEGPPSLALAKHYAELGFVAIAPDCITAEERISHGLQAYDTTAFYKEHKNISLAGKMLADHMHAVDVLAETPKVDPSRIGAVGHGLGGLNALMLVAFDERPPHAPQVAPSPDSLPTPTRPAGVPKTKFRFFNPPKKTMNQKRPPLTGSTFWPSAPQVPPSSLHP